jgi:hypothetical protein
LCVFIVLCRDAVTIADGNILSTKYCKNNVDIPVNATT